MSFETHIAGGLTTLCRCWAVTRRDGVVLGFTDHDAALAFDGVTFRPGGGLSASALQSGVGLAVDNGEALGALGDDRVTARDIEAGLYDGAEVRGWIVNWADVGERRVVFRGSIGEVTRSGGAFRAELRGLTEALGRAMGRVFQKPCSAVLGDARCRFDAGQPGYFLEVAVEAVGEARVLRWTDGGGFEDGWFADGVLRVLDGSAAGEVALVGQDETVKGQCVVTLRTALRGVLSAGDRVRVEAGCDKRMETCRLKFANLANFQGFPDIPGEDWMMAVPRSGNANSGGSRR